MRKWLWRVAVPPTAFLLGWGAARLCTPAPRQTPPHPPVHLQPFLTPPLRHGGCQGPLWLPPSTANGDPRWTPTP
jgi:hypothetical protein